MKAEKLLINLLIKLHNQTNKRNDALL